MDNKNFLKDIGLEFSAEMAKQIAEINGEPAKSNLISFVSKTSMLMDSPTIALQVHVTNLISTYGEKAVLQAIFDIAKG